MSRLTAMYCAPCRAFRDIRDWRERRDVLTIELDPCGHVVERDARLEWRTDRREAA